MGCTACIQFRPHLARKRPATRSRLPSRGYRDGASGSALHKRAELRAAIDANVDTGGDILPIYQPRSERVIRHKHRAAGEAGRRSEGAANQVSRGSLNRVRRLLDRRRKLAGADSDRLEIPSRIIRQQ